MPRTFRHLVEIPNDATAEEIMADLLAIAKDEDVDAADAYKAKLVTLRIWTLAKENQQETVEETELVVASNIGYMSGYYSFEDRQLICRVFQTTHPIFGDKSPTPEEAFQMGQDWAKEHADDEGEQRRVVLGVPQVRGTAHVPRSVRRRSSRRRVQQSPHLGAVLWNDLSFAL